MSPNDESRSNDSAEPIADPFHIEQRLADAGLLPKTASHRSDGGQPHGVASFSGDQFAQLQNQLRQGDEQLALTRQVLHDVNNLLLVIGFSSRQLLAQLPDDDPNRACVVVIDDARKQAAELTRQLRNMPPARSRVEVQRAIAVDLNEFVSQAESMVRRFMRSDVIMTVNLAALPTLVTANPDRLDRLVLHLLLHALSSVKDGGWITIETCHEEALAGDDAGSSTEKHARYVRLSMTETGIGCTDDLSAGILGDPRATGDIRLPSRSIIEKLSDACGGQTEFVSSVETGTRIDIRFPSAVNHRVTHEGSTTEIRIVRGTETILLVEDDSSIRPFIKRILESAGYQVLDARDGVDAIAIASQHTGAIDLLLTDLLLPGIPGRAVAERLNSILPNLAVIFMSGHSHEDLPNGGCPIPRVSFLQKPFQMGELLSKVRKLLETRTETS